MVTNTEQQEEIEEAGKRKIYREREQLRRRLKPEIRSLVPDSVKVTDVSYLTGPQSEKFYEAVVDKVVVNLWGRERVERTRHARSLKRGAIVLDPLHVRWEEWFKKAGIADPEKYFGYVEKYADSAGKNIESNPRFWPAFFKPSSGSVFEQFRNDQKN